MSNLKDFNWTGFWNDCDYAFESYIGKAVTNEDIKATEVELGYKLPSAYIELLKNHSGGVLNRNCFINDNGECVYVTGIYGIDRGKKNSLCGEFGNEFWISKWKYPSIGVVVADTISGGHDMIFLDYRECGPIGEPKVVRIDQEGDYAITVLADNFGDFIKGLYISIEEITDEEFQALSDEEKVKFLKEQEDLDIDRTMELLTNIGIENLSPILLGILGRIYNNNDKPEEAIKVLNSIGEEYRDAVWHYRCAYSYGAIVYSNHEAYTSDNMQQMLALVDNGVQLASKENRNDIRKYCFEIMDMCYMQMDFEQCEAEYPELCKAYSQYVAEKKRNKRSIPHHRTITVEEIQATDDMWTIEFLDEKDDAVYEYDGIFEDVFVHENPQLFVFDGTYTIPE